MLYKFRKRAGGPLSKFTLQSVYEDNIKKYGTLTCEYCKKMIQFGNDSVDHRLPISRGGDNSRENLNISCRFCNFSKNNKTVEEFLAKKGEKNGI